MKPSKFHLTAALVLLLSSPALAERLYVGDNVDIDVRTGQGYDFRIIALIHPGDRVDVLENGDGWSMVRLDNGKEGWMLTRYLTREKPVGPMLEGLQKEHQALKESCDKTLAENAALKTENDTLKTTLGEKETERNTAVQSFEDLKKGSTEFLEVSGKLEAANTELGALKKRNQELEGAVAKLENNQITRGLLTGAGILLAGFLTGMITRKKRRRSSLL